MARFEAVTRRTFIADLGKATLGLIVFAAVGCAADEDSPEATGAARATDGASPAGGELGGWQRVALGSVSAYILVRGGETVIVDTGVAGSEDEIAQGLSEVGSKWSDVGHVVLTHKHPDHIGSAEAVLERASEAVAYAGQGDIEAIKVPRELRAVGDGDMVAGLEIVETPGHTPGHVSVLDKTGRVYVAGDSMIGQDGGVGLPPAQFTEDMEEAKRSVAKVGELEFEIALFGHGDPLTSDASARVAALGRDA